MTRFPKQKLQGAARLGASLACFLMGAWSAAANIVITSATVVNVTPSQFSVVASVSDTIPSATNVTIAIFSDPAGATNLAGQVGVEYFPLNSGDPTATNSYAGLLSMTALRQDELGLGLIHARISYCAPNTTYYYQITVYNTNGSSAVWPAGGRLPSATTAQSNSFVIQSQQLLVTLIDADPPGSIITLSNANSASALAAVVGDGAATNQAFFNLNDLIAAAGGTNYSPIGAQLFTASVLGGTSSFLTQTYPLVFTGGFSVGQSSAVLLGALISTISVGTGAMLTGDSASVPISIQSQGALVGFSFVLNFPTNLFTAISLAPTSPLLNTASLSVLAPNTIQISFMAATGLNLQGTQQLAQLNFTAAANQPSAFVPLSPQEPQGTNVNPQISNAFFIQPGRAIIVGPKPLLDIQLVAGSPDLVLYGNPGDGYQIQSSTNFAAGGGWSNFLAVSLTNVTQVITNLDPAALADFFRAYVLSGGQNGP